MGDPHTDPETVVDGAGGKSKTPNGSGQAHLGWWWLGLVALIVLPCVALWIVDRTHTRRCTGTNSLQGTWPATVVISCVSGSTPGATPAPLAVRAEPQRATFSLDGGDRAGRAISAEWGPNGRR